MNWIAIKKPPEGGFFILVDNKLFTVFVLA